MSTRRTIEQWVELFNAADVEGISALHADDAVNAVGPLTCTPINLVIDGDWDSAQLKVIHPDVHDR